MFMKNNNVHLVMHGGLGNQFFQYFKFSLICQRNNSNILYIHEEFLQKYNTPRYCEILNFIMLNEGKNFLISNPCLITNLRIPKVIYKIFNKEYVLRIPFFGCILDGYFQKPSNFLIGDKDLINATLTKWIKILSNTGLISKKDHDSVCHLRLGDFFDNPSSALLYARERLESFREVIHIATDEEAIVANAIKLTANPKNYVLLPTSTLDSWGVFSLLTKYRVIHTNGSTLAFWASISLLMCI